MKKVEIYQSDAEKAFSEGSQSDKNLLTRLMPDIFKRKITDHVKTLDDALQIYKPSTNALIMLSYSGVDEDCLATRSFLEATIICDVLNEGWKPNWDDSNERKWNPVFDMRAGVGFSRSHYDYWRTSTNVGSRLCFKSEELAKYAATQFVDIYKKFMTK